MACSFAVFASIVVAGETGATASAGVVVGGVAACDCVGTFGSVCGCGCAGTTHAARKTSARTAVDFMEGILKAERLEGGKAGSVGETFTVLSSKERRHPERSRGTWVGGRFR